MDPKLVAYLDNGLAMSAVEFKTPRIRAHQRLAQRPGADLSRHHALLCPTMAHPAVPHGGSDAELLEGGPGRHLSLPRRHVGLQPVRHVPRAVDPLRLDQRQPAHGPADRRAPSRRPPRRCGSARRSSSACPGPTAARRSRIAACRISTSSSSVPARPGSARRARRAKAGLSHQVIEASHRIGGRAYTEDLAPGVPFDLGCHWLHCVRHQPAGSRRPTGSASSSIGTLPSPRISG